MSRHVLSVLRKAMPGEVPTDASALPELWRWQMPGVLAADVVWALYREGSGRSLRVVQRLLPGVRVVPRLGAVRPRMTTRRVVGLAKIHVVARGNPHPPGTSLHRNWWRYREGMPVDVYRRLGGSSRCLEGDVKRGLVKVA